MNVISSDLNRGKKRIYPRVHNPIEEIRQVTREERERKISCLSGCLTRLFSLSFSFTRSSFIECQNSGHGSGRTRHDD